MDRKKESVEMTGIDGEDDKNRKRPQNEESKYKWYNMLKRYTAVVKSYL